MPLDEVRVENVDITSSFWSPIQKRAREKTTPAMIKRQKELGYWDCLTWKEGDPRKIGVSFHSLTPLSRLGLSALAHK